MTRSTLGGCLLDRIGEAVDGRCDGQQRADVGLVIASHSLGRGGLVCARPDHRVVAHCRHFPVSVAVLLGLLSEPAAECAAGASVAEAGSPQLTRSCKPGPSRCVARWPANHVVRAGVTAMRHVVGVESPWSVEPGHGGRTAARVFDHESDCARVRLCVGVRSVPLLDRVSQSRRPCGTARSRPRADPSAGGHGAG